MNTKKYSWLLFDADGTLFDYEIAEYNALQKTCLDYDLIFSHDKHEKYQEINKLMFQKYEKGEISIKDLQEKRFKWWANELGLEIDSDSFPKDYIKNLSNETTLLPNVLETIQKLAKVYKMAIITNGISKAQRHRLEQSEIANYFNEIVISEEIGVSKPNPAYFEYVIKKIGNPIKDEILIIGDGLTSDIIGGNKFGLDTCWLNRSNINPKSEIISKYTINDFSQLLEILIY